MKDNEGSCSNVESEARTEERHLKQPECEPGPSEALAEPRTQRMLSYFRWRKQFTTVPACRAIVCLLLLLGLAARAQDTFQLLKTYTPVPDSPPARSMTLVTEDRQITFIPPENSIVKPYHEKQELWITYPDDRCLLKLAVSTNSAELLKSGYTNELRKLVQKRYPDAAVGEATLCHCHHSLGLSFDIQEFTAYKTKMTTRLAFVPVPNGMLEVSLRSTEARFPSQQCALSRLLGWMRVERSNPASLSVRKD
jgi:hypothetical protein